MDEQVVKYLNKLNAEAVGLALKLCETEKAGDVMHILATASALVAAAVCRNAPNENALKLQVKQTLDRIHSAGYKQINAPSFVNSASRFIEVIQEDRKNAENKH